MASIKLHAEHSMFARMKAQSRSAAAGSDALPRSATGLPMALGCALAASLPSVVAGLRVNHELWSGGLFNPDSSMRLVRLNDILAAGAPLHAVMRDGSGLGNVLPWSHLLDSLLLLLAAPLATILGWHDALHMAALAFGPLCMAGLGLAVAWAAAPVAPRHFGWIGAAAAGSAPMIQGYGVLGVVHHHVLVTLAPVMAAGWALRVLQTSGDEGRASRCGMALGAWAAAGIWLSPEALPFVLMAQGALWATWFGPATERFDRSAMGRALVAAAGTMTMLLTLAWLADPPAAGLLAIEPDRLSLPFVLLALGATTTALAARTTPRRIPPLLCGGAVAAGWLIAFPQFLQGTSGLMTPEQAHAFFDNIGEMEPVRTAGGAIEALLGGFFALAALCVFILRAPAASRIPLGFAIACTAAMLLLASLHIRFAAYPSVAGAVLLPVVLAAVGATNWAPARRSLVRAGLAVSVIIAPLMAPLAASAGPRARPAAIGQACSLSGAIPLLAAHPGEITLANVNATPDLLYRSRVLTVGSLYHRNPQGYMRLRAAWLEVPGEVPGQAMLATGATLVLACPGEPRSAVIDGALPDTLLDHLAANNPPSWLRRLGDAGPNGFVLYAVDR